MLKLLESCIKIMKMPTEQISPCHKEKWDESGNGCETLDIKCKNIRMMKCIFFSQCNVAKDHLE